MRLFRTKVWRWLDIGMLKWSSILLGMIAGAYLSEFVKQYVWVFAVAALLLVIRPAVRYWGDDEGK
jgi:uncharacterized membrane protein YoaT (DUF817 family)